MAKYQGALLLADIMVQCGRAHHTAPDCSLLQPPALPPAALRKSKEINQSTKEVLLCLCFLIPNPTALGAKSLSTIMRFYGLPENKVAIASRGMAFHDKMNYVSRLEE